MGPFRADHASFDWLVLTAANARQAAAYEEELRDRFGRDGSMAGGDRVAHAFAMADARDARIGSGAATVLALAEVARRLLRARRARSLAELFRDERVLILHSGGDSRRLPMHAVEGKIFAPIPRSAEGGACAGVLDLLIDDLASLAPRAGGEVLVGAGDAVIGLARDPVRLEGAGVIGVAQKAGVARASRHGVFVRGRGDEVAAFLQKPDLRALRASGALGRDGRALVDLGLFSFDPASVAALLDGAGVRLRAGRIAFVPGGLADRASRAELPSVDLYREIAMALPARARRDGYLGACAPGVLAKPLASLFDAMRGTDFRVQVAEVGDFLHIGSMRETLDALCGPRARIRAFGVATDGRAAQALDAVPPARAMRARAIFDRCDATKLAPEGDNIVTRIDGALTGALPKEVAVFGVPLSRGGEAVVACHIDDDFKTAFAQGGTVLGVSLERFAARARAAPSAIPEGDGTLWDARLWCRADASDALATVRWMWEGRAAPAAWRRARKWSLRELVAQADAAAGLAQRARGAWRAACADGGVPPIERARAAARCAKIGGVSRAECESLRRAALVAVGEAVLSRFELPARPVRAAIMHDQAVWTSMPVRVDLAGGWTDTPPICNAVGGGVVNVAVTLRGQLPIQVVAKLEEEPVIRITSTDLGETRVIRDARDLAERGDPTRWSSLAENALVLTGAAPADPKASLAAWLRTVGGGISLTLFSAVPKGSGLGTSSILGAATIHALDRVFGRERTPPELFAATSALEQMLGSRGGWQDQVGGVVGGFKIGRTAPGADQRPRVERLTVPARAASELAERSLLYFTGERRMAKNILESVVWNWLTHEPAAIDAVRRLRANAGRMRAALEAGSMEVFLAEIGEYCACKRAIDPGSCPRSFDELAARWRRELSSWCFAGAGGGGFMLLVARSERAAARLAASIERAPPHPRARAFALEVDAVGLRCAVL